MGRAREGTVIPFRDTIYAKMGTFSEVPIFAAQAVDTFSPASDCRQTYAQQLGLAWGDCEGAVAKWKFCSGRFFRPKGQRKARDCGKPAAKLSVFCMAKPALASEPAPNVEKGFNYSLSSRNLGQMRSQSSLVTFHPELFQVKSKCQKEQLRANILPSPCEEAAEAKVVLEQPEGAFHLD